MKEKQIWTMDELVALTDEVQLEKVDFRGKVVEFQFCELTEKEEPKFTGVDETLPEEDKMALFQEIGTQRVMMMLGKANSKNPDGPSISEENWGLLPTTLRYAISNKIIGVQEEAAENFRD
jgi:hypothetical protein|tara:strand:- start:141 stop:503 length:363 start_codon:yes stop_codon:yes gene_type:complete